MTGAKRRSMRRRGTARRSCRACSRRGASPSRSKISPRTTFRAAAITAASSPALLRVAGFDDLPVAGADGEAAEREREDEGDAAERGADPDAPPGPRRRGAGDRMGVRRLPRGRRALRGWQVAGHQAAPRSSIRRIRPARRGGGSGSRVRSESAMSRPTMTAFASSDEPP